MLKYFSIYLIHWQPLNNLNWVWVPILQNLSLKFTYVFVTSSQHNTFVNPEYMTSWKSIRPTSTNQISYCGALWVWIIFVTASTIACIETNLRIVKKNFIDHDRLGPNQVKDPPLTFFFLLRQRVTYFPVPAHLLMKLTEK